MRLEEFLRQEKSIRQGVHFHDGVWWRSTSPQCCQPLYPLQEVNASLVRPSRVRSFLRVSHLTAVGGTSNSRWVCLFLDGTNLSDFRFEGLRHEKRKAINRAQRSGIRVETIADIERHWGDLREIYESTARRTRYGLPESYYREREDDWRTGLRREYGLKHREWFGAFHGRKLVAFLYTCLVDDTAALLVTKFNDDFANMRPSDAVHFHAISFYKEQLGCRRIFAGREITDGSSIDRFKAGFGFEKRELPAFEWTNPLAVAVGHGIVRLGGPILRRFPSLGVPMGLGAKTEVLAAALHRWSSK